MVEEFFRTAMMPSAWSGMVDERSVSSGRNLKKRPL
jgi:hypothetical protein